MYTYLPRSRSGMVLAEPYTVNAADGSGCSVVGTAGHAHGAATGDRVTDTAHATDQSVRVIYRIRPRPRSSRTPSPVFQPAKADSVAALRLATQRLPLDSDSREQHHTGGERCGGQGHEQTGPSDHRDKLRSDQTLQQCSD